MIFPTVNLLESVRDEFLTVLIDKALYQEVYRIVNELPHFTHLGFECLLGNRSAKMGLFQRIQ